MNKNEIIERMQGLVKKRKLKDDDPLVQYLIEACVEESLDIRNEISAFERIVSDSLKKQYLPLSEPSLKIPSHCLACTEFLDTYEDSSTQIISISKTEKFQIENDSFTAPKDFKILNAKVAVQIFDNQWLDFRKGYENFETGEIFKGLWIGIDFKTLKKKNILEKLNFLNINLGSKFKPESRNFKNLIVSDGNRELSLSRGWLFQKENKATIHFETDLTERYVIGYYYQEYISIPFTEVLEVQGIIPEQLNSLSKQISQKHASNFVWLKLVVPSADKELYGNIHCRLNCFPLINRQIFEEKISTPSTINPLSMIPEGQVFQALEAIITYPKTNFQYSLEDLGVNKNNQLSGSKLIRYIINVFEKDFQAFQDFDKVAIRKALDEIEEKIRTLKTVFKTEDQREVKGSEKVYLQLKSKEPIQLLKCRYWTTSKFGSNYEIGTKLQAKNLNDFNIELVKPSKTQHIDLKLNKYEYKEKYNVLSNNRLVTKKELEFFILSELGDLVKSVSINNDAEIGNDRNEGIIRIIKIVIVIKELEEVLSPKGLSSYLEQKINLLWHGMYPIRIIVETEEN